MKKINTKGFTLIELLAVITIMGILMMVAIPAVSRTIENTRRDTFATLAKTYIGAIRNAVIGDELKCGDDNLTVSGTEDGYYYFPIRTEPATGGDTTTANAQSQTLDIMESGGKSSWGNADVQGIIVWKKEHNTNNDGYNYTYYAALVDKGNHGIGVLTSEDEITRSNVLTVASNQYTAVGITPTAGSTGTIGSLKKVGSDTALAVADIKKCALK